MKSSESRKRPDAICSGPRRTRQISSAGSGAQVVQDAREMSGGRRIASVKDPGGNRIGLLLDS